MPRTIDVPKLKRNSITELAEMRDRVDEGINAGLNYLLLRWICRMSAVDVHETWERYVETRLVAALNHNPHRFLREQNIKGVKHVSYGLATYIVRGGNRYFDFRSMGELISMADKWLGEGNNIFRKIPANDREYMDALAAIRNCIVHGSDAATVSYKRKLRAVYGIKSAPKPDEFLYAQGRNRPKTRLHGLITVVERSIQDT
jgi:hypothetical protein